MDQTLPFVLDDGKAYDIKGAKKFGHRVDRCALTNDKQQISSMYLLMVLIGSDLQLSLREKVFESLQRRKILTAKLLELRLKRKL